MRSVRFRLQKAQISKMDPTEKFLFELDDGNMIESVLMKYNYGNSVCISSQAGCRMGCRFCASTIDGLERNLTDIRDAATRSMQIQKITGERVIEHRSHGNVENRWITMIISVRFIHMISDEQRASYQSAKYYGIHLRNCARICCRLAERRTADHAGTFSAWF